MGLPGALSSFKPEKTKKFNLKQCLISFRKTIFHIFQDRIFQSQAQRFLIFFQENISLYFGMNANQVVK